MTLGLGTSLEAYGSYPSLLFNDDEFASGRGFANVGFKARILGERSSPFTLAVDAQMRRSVADNQEDKGRIPRGSTTFFSTFESSLPYYAETHPGEIFAEALPAEPIAPGARASGALYFGIDLYVKKCVELRAYLSGAEKSGPPDFALPFIVEKR